MISIYGASNECVVRTIISQGHQDRNVFYINVLQLLHWHTNYLLVVLDEAVYIEINRFVVHAMSSIGRYSTETEISIIIP